MHPGAQQRTSVSSSCWRPCWMRSPVRSSRSVVCSMRSRCAGPLAAQSSPRPSSARAAAPPESAAAASRALERSFATSALYSRTCAAQPAGL